MDKNHSPKTDFKTINASFAFRLASVDFELTKLLNKISYYFYCIPQYLMGKISAAFEHV